MPINHNFKEGDPINVYDGTSVLRGVIECFHDENILCVRVPHAFVYAGKMMHYHYKQCRKVKIKKKPGKLKILMNALRDTFANFEAREMAKNPYDAGALTCKMERLELLAQIRLEIAKIFNQMEKN